MKTTKEAVKKETAKDEKVQTAKDAQVQKSTSKVDEILNPSADVRIKKLETLNRLAEKKNTVDGKLSDLRNFNASNDGTNLRMDFNAANGYKFGISDPETIKVLLGFVENKLSTLQANVEKEILEFQF